MEPPDHENHRDIAREYRIDDHCSRPALFSVSLMSALILYFAGQVHWAVWTAGIALGIFLFTGFLLQVRHGDASFGRNRPVSPRRVAMLLIVAVVFMGTITWLFLRFWPGLIPSALILLGTAPAMAILLHCGWSLRCMRIRQRHGFCRFCGHDLHGSSEDICPECGKPVTQRGHQSPGGAGG